MEIQGASCFIDFDGTIVMEDIAEIILIKYAQGNWRQPELDAIAGKIGLEDVQKIQYGMIRGTMDQLLETALSIDVREGFSEFLGFLTEKSVSSTILSAGLSFTIEEFIHRNNWDIDYVSAKAKLTDNGVDLQFPEINNELYTDYKHHYVSEASKNGKKTIYIGDGSSDFTAISHADIRCTVRNSTLSKFCKERGLDHVEFDTFTELMQLLS